MKHVPHCCQAGRLRRTSQCRPVAVNCQKQAKTNSRLARGARFNIAGNNLTLEAGRSSETLDEASARTGKDKYRKQGTDHGFIHLLVENRGLSPIVAFANPVGIQYVPSKYGPTFKYMGQNATVVVNPQGNVVTTWGTSAAGVAK